MRAKENCTAQRVASIVTHTNKRKAKDEHVLNSFQVHRADNKLLEQHYNAWNR